MVILPSFPIFLSLVAGSIAAAVKPAAGNITERGPHDFFLGFGDSIARRATINYDQDYTTGGTVNYSPSSTGFSVTWSNAEDFVVGVGWTTGSTA
jgi:endo-1,4-beta-xylanase